MISLYAWDGKRSFMCKVHAFDCLWEARNLYSMIHAEYMSLSYIDDDSVYHEWELSC